MSAIGYLFARDMQKELKVPFGIITESLRRQHRRSLDQPRGARGGSAIEAAA